MAQLVGTREHLPSNRMSFRPKTQLQHHGQVRGRVHTMEQYSHRAAKGVLLISKRLPMDSFCHDAINNLQSKI